MNPEKPQSAYGGVFIICVALLAGCAQKGAESNANAADSGSGIALFNGHSLEGWHADVPDMDADSALKSPFLIRDSLLVSLGTPGGHLITDRSYSNYILDLEYRFAGVPGNCGVLV